MLNALPLVRFTPHTPVDLEQIFAEYDETLTRGWAYSAGEYNLHSEVISAPIMLGSRPKGAISVVRISEKRIGRAALEAYVPALLQSTEEFSATLSFRLASAQDESN
ncbi:IclR family transcriptional regulator C-terminal domain-containing protein [Leucobacter insecticola]|uniref:IclR family transcriptional regulator C-terminal domain-containing protein n=1 Tax=Leucobacter insecticola TaxID=2714934 RepID=UPI001FCBFFB5|nr:IclR family transcriptional regulator C-terminal domain-containing protein [Leucobacter insecticola]